MNALDHLALANAKKAELKALGVKVEILDPLEKARRNPTSLRLAVNSKCWDCQGAGADGHKWTRESITQCAALDCSLWNVRPYQEKDNCQ